MKIDALGSGQAAPRMIYEPCTLLQTAPLSSSLYISAQWSQYGFELEKLLQRARVMIGPAASAQQRLFSLTLWCISALG